MSTSHNKHTDNATINDHYIIRRKHLIKVTYFSENFENGKIHHYKYTTQLMIGFGASMREIAKTVIKSSISKRSNWIEQIYDDQPIAIYLNHRTTEEIEKAPFGICYDLSKNGNIKFLDGYKPLNYDWTYEKMVELHKSGYISGDIDHIIIETPDGLGSPGEINLEGLLNGILIFIEVASSIEGTLQLKDRVISEITYRKMANDFKKNGLYRLKQIRLLIETNKKWKLKKLMNALSTNRNVTVAILKKLGYTAKKGIWSFDNASIESLELRKKWLQQEKIGEKEINKKIIEQFGK